jgi:F0F1-type ATP synthase membrane subunit c/vacuolar-type H+-ATPase subunit K
MPTAISTQRKSSNIGTAIFAALPLFALIVAFIVASHGAATPSGADVVAMNWTTF